MRRSSGKPGVFSVVPGPGVLNAGAALLTAFGSNEPVLCLTGQVPTQFLGKGRGHLHEMPDQLATLRTFVKWADRIEYPGQRADRGVARLSGDDVRPPRAGGARKCLERVYPARPTSAARPFDPSPRHSPTASGSRTPRP